MQESNTRDHRTPLTPNSKKCAQVHPNWKHRINNKEITSINHTFKINLGREEITIGPRNVDLQQLDPLRLIQFPIDVGCDLNVTNFVGSNIFEGQSSQDFDMDRNLDQSEDKAPDEVHVHNLSQKDLRKTGKSERDSEKREREREHTTNGWRQLFKFHKFISDFLCAESQSRTNQPILQ